MREDGGVDLVVILFESDGLVDFLTQVDRFSCMLDYNGRLMDNYSKGIASLNSMKDELTSSKAVLEKRKSELDERRAELEVSKKEAEKLVADAEKDVATAESTLANVEALEKQYGDERSKKLAELQKTTNSQYVGGVFKWPLPSKYEKVSCGFGWRIHPVTGKPQFHNGIDIPAPYGTAITAVGDGTVVQLRGRVLRDGRPRRRNRIVLLARLEVRRQGRGQGQVRADYRLRRDVRLRDGVSSESDYLQGFGRGEPARLFQGLIYGKENYTDCGYDRACGAVRLRVGNRAGGDEDSRSGRKQYRDRA